MQMFNVELKPAPTTFFHHFNTARQRRARAAALRKADASRDAKRFQHAAEQYGDVIRVWGADFDILVQLGNMLKDSGAVEQAEAAYRHAMLLNSSNADCYLQLGHLMKLTGRLLEAEKYYIEARRLEPARCHGEAELNEIAAKRPLMSGNPTLTPCAEEKGGRSLIMRSRVLGNMTLRRN